MKKHPTWTCHGCGYTWKQPVGALPVTAACPACGVEHPDVRAALDAAQPEPDTGE